MAKCKAFMGLVVKGLRLKIAAGDNNVLNASVTELLEISRT